jgi:5-carboxyvanillate decarboxylase
MATNRRSVLRAGVSAVSAALLGDAGAAMPRGAHPPRLRRIATEEAWSIPEHVAALCEIGKTSWDNLDARSWSKVTPTSLLAKRLVDVAERAKVMEQLDIDMHVLSLTSPGVQMFEREHAIAMAALANDHLAQIVQAQPARFAGLASFAPQDPARAAKEMDRCINTLKLNGFIVNSHTNNEYLDLPKYWEIFEAAAALNAAIYIHPRCPADTMAKPYADYELQAAIWGFQAEVGVHVLRLMLSGVFDRFPNLTVVIGHMGENVPFHLWRTDHWYERRRASALTKLRPSEIFKRNIVVTTSGVEHAPALKYAIDVLGADNIMWAIDYPYEEMAPSVSFMNEVPLSEEDRAKIFHKNAERVFHIAPA